MLNFNISVIIPVYNAEKYLGRAIGSVLIHPEVTQLILVEDGSRDKSPEICRQMQETDKRILVHHHPGNRNKGASASRNLGIKHVTNEFIAFLDADDYYLPHRFKQTAACFEADESIEGVYEMVGIHAETGAIKNYSVIEAVNPDELFENLQPIGEKLWFSIDGLTVKRSIFERSGFFDETLQTSEDTLQWFKMAAVAKLVAGSVEHPVTIAETRTNSLTTDMALVQKDFVLMFLKLFRSCKDLHCTHSRKELVLNSLFFYASNIPYKANYTGLNKLILFLKIIIVDPGYVLGRSNVFRRYAGNMIGYNRVLHYFTNSKLNKR